MLYNGQPSAYALKLKREYGDDVIEKMEKLRHKITKLTPSWYEEQIAHYKALI